MDDCEAGGGLPTLKELERREAARGSSRALGRGLQNLRGELDLGPHPHEAAQAREPRVEFEISEKATGGLASLVEALAKVPGLSEAELEAPDLREELEELVARRRERHRATALAARSWLAQSAVAPPCPAASAARSTSEKLQGGTD